MPFDMNPNINFLLNGPCLNSPPNMVPAGSLNIPRLEDTLSGGVEEEKWHIRNPTYVPKKYEPPISEYKPIRFEPIKFDLPKYEPIKMEPIKTKTYDPLIKDFGLFPKKPFWKE